MEANDMKAMREALAQQSVNDADTAAWILDKNPEDVCEERMSWSELCDMAYKLAAGFATLRNAVEAALAKPPHTGKWENGKDYEYEFAYCSECGRMQWADWGSHKQAEESIEAFADDYRFCPGCGAKMEGGVYVK